MDEDFNRENLRDDLFAFFEGEPKHVKKADPAPAAKDTGGQSHPQGRRNSLGAPVKQALVRNDTHNEARGIPKELKTYPTLDELVDKDKLYIEDALDFMAKLDFPFTAAIDITVFGTAEGPKNRSPIVDEKMEVSIHHVFNWYELQGFALEPLEAAYYVRGFSGPVVADKLAETNVGEQVGVPAVPRPRGYDRYLAYLPAINTFAETRMMLNLQSATA